jgi:DNA-binding transcriptional LysR family regulator
MEQPDLRQLRYFLAVAEELHFGRAAERVGIAQPPLTQQIQRLERLLGCQLLVRGRKTRLTEAGARLKEDAQRILDQAENAFAMTRRVARGEAGQLRVGVPPSVMLTNLPSAVRKYREKYPGVGFTLRELSTSAIEAALAAGEIDLGFLREVQPKSPLASTLFMKEAMIAVLPADHPLARVERASQAKAGHTATKSRLKLDSLKRQRFVFFPRRLGMEFHDRLVGACREAGFMPEIVQEVTQWSTVVSLVEAGMGVSLAPASVAKFVGRGVVYREVSLKGAALTTNVYAGWRSEGLSGAASSFLQMAIREVKP